MLYVLDKTILQFLNLFLLLELFTESNRVFNSPAAQVTRAVEYVDCLKTTQMSVLDITQNYMMVRF